MRSLSAALLILFLLPATAVARAAATAPPGNSAVSQYLEVVPTANGGRPSTVVSPGASGAATSRVAPSPLTPAVQRALARRGASGRGVLALVNATGVADRTGAGRHRPGSPAALSSDGGPGVSDRRARGTAPLNALTNALTGSSAAGGLSPWLPAILIVTALGGGVLAVLRRRRKP